MSPPSTDGHNPVQTMFSCMAARIDWQVSSDGFRRLVGGSRPSHAVELIEILAAKPTLEQRP